ncbi:MAG: glycoside hydrolase family 43 protein [Acidobacteriota bacterium]|nr:glycoside hydrolase family 43 protein [Acidobacteriota bacterium]
MVKFFNTKVFCLLFIALFSTANLAQTAQTAKQAETWSNPIFDFDFPDPTVVRAGDGYFYAYATQAVVNGKLHHIQVARSNDLVNWERMPDALPQKPVWADKSEPKFWAPHVSFADGKYFMYYSADPNTQKGLCLAVAVADTPGGPFIDIGKPLKCGASFINIDPMAFDDPKTGKKLLYWGSGFEPIKVQELAANRIEFAPNTELVDVVFPIKNEDPNNYQRLIEGVWVTYRKGFYYLFYSGDNCCGDKAHYAAMVARSKSATGKFETLAQAGGKANSVILELNGEWLAPGHNSVIRDDAGRDWMFYHAINTKKRNVSKDETIGGDRDVRRVMLMNRLVYKNGWVYAEGGTPTLTSKKFPKIRRRKNH